ncbi:hypothetical protein HPB47_016482 [Ixodes persulcatus]|uniref:Uncharacterized protein n=1 Tax=Ixodes persulcatus TaxID=34615 RepID=A0AC60QRR8_IXOPE|nr:hypothetical protein HPB47_016482 [Ixodes persulcatus]
MAIFYAAEPTDIRRYVPPNLLSLDAGGSKLCPNCGVEHELPPIVDGRRAYTCTPNCVICGGKHFTGSKECNKGYVPRQKPPSEEEPVEEVRRRKKARCPDSPEEDKTLTAITELAKTVNIRFQQLDGHLTERFQKMKERSQQAFVLSRVTYAASYMHLPKTARKQIDAIIRKSYKVALGLPNPTSTARFDQLGIHNTFQELCDAQRAAQISRLSRTPTGRRTQRRAGIDYKDKPPPKWDMQPDWRRAVEDDPRAFLVDASPYPDRSKSYVAAVHNISGSNTATIKACDIHEAEEAAIAIRLLAASRTGSSGTVTTDSKTAASSFLYGRIGSPARKILRSFRAPRDKNSRYHVVWVPAHAGHEVNEAAHSLASRVATSRDCEEEGGREFSLGEHSYAAPATEEAPTRFCDATRVERERRRVLPPPHPELNHQQARRNSKGTSMAEEKTSFLTGRPFYSQMSCASSCS